MPPDRKEFDAKFGGNKVEVLPRSTATEAIKAAEVRATKLTASDEWNSFLAKCQALLNQAMMARDQHLFKCGCESDANELRKHQLEFQACAARVITLQEVMGIPAQVIEECQSALSHVAQ